MKLTIPELSLVVLVGPFGCGKSTFARTHFKPTEVRSSDFCRGFVPDEENSQAFALCVEGLERFARREPLRRAHERVSGVLAIESQLVNPRL